MDVGATWKVAAESNVLMTEEEAKARLVLEIAYTEMKDTKNSPPPGYDPQPVLKKDLLDSKSRHALPLFDCNSRVESAAAESMNAEDAAASTAAHVQKPPREASTIDAAAAAADLVGIMSEPPVQTPEKVADDDEDPCVRGGDAGDASQPGLYICIILLSYM